MLSSIVITFCGAVMALRGLILNCYNFCFFYSTLCSWSWLWDQCVWTCCICHSVMSFRTMKDQILSDWVCHSAPCTGSLLDYCNSLLSGLPARTVKPLQMGQNATAHVVLSQPKTTHATPLLMYLLPFAARIKFKSLMLALQMIDGSSTVTARWEIKRNSFLCGHLIVERVT